MKKLIFLALLIPSFVFAADVKLDWDASAGATGYKVYMSLDKGVTWLAPLTTTTKPFVYPGVPEDKEIKFKISAFNGVTEAVNNYAGVWYDHRALLLNPTGFGIK